MATTAEYDLMKICRACRLESNELVSIFDPRTDNGGTTLGEMILCCTQIAVEADDGMPPSVCTSCAFSIAEAFRFRQRYEQSHSILQRYIERQTFAVTGEQPAAIGQSVKLEEDESGAKQVHLDDDSIAYRTKLTLYTVVPKQGKQEDEMEILVEQEPFVQDVTSFEDLIEEDLLEEFEVHAEETQLNTKVKQECVYSCDLCDDVSLENRKDIELHMLLHRDHTTEVCTICGKRFSTPFLLSKHMQTHEEGASCGFCEMKFFGTNWEADYSAHLVNEHPKDEPRASVVPELKEKYRKEAICRICDVSFGRIGELRNHLKTHTDPSTYVDANIPTKPFLFIEGYVLPDYVDYLVQQVRQGTVERFYQIVKANGEELELDDSDTDDDEDGGSIQRQHVCQLCNQYFGRIDTVMGHFGEHHPDDHTFPCAHCVRRFPNWHLLQRHLRLQCENKVKKIYCTVCNEKFMWQTSLNRHALDKHKPSKLTILKLDSAVKEEGSREKQFTCSICSKTFLRSEHLERHTKIHNPLEKKFECPVCHKKFNRKDNLACHIKIHQRDKFKDKEKLLCVYCGRGFSNSSNLTVHVRRHTGDKPYQCDICDKRFPRSSDLYCHRRTHTGEKPCICTACGKGFSRSNKLIRHMRVHTGTRPYVCPYCDSSFTQSNDLTLHIRRHTGEKPYICGVCNERFIQGTALKVHQRMLGHHESTNDIPGQFDSISVNNPHRTSGLKQCPDDGTTVKPIKVIKMRNKRSGGRTRKKVSATTVAKTTTEPSAADSLAPVKLPEQQLFVYSTVPYAICNYDALPSGLLAQSFNP